MYAICMEPCQNIGMLSWVELIRHADSWSDLQVPDPTCGALIQSTGPWSVLRDPGASRGALICPAMPWFVLSWPDPSCGVLCPGFILWGPDLSREALIRLAGPSFVQRGPDLFSRPWFAPSWGPASSCGALIRPGGLGHRRRQSFQVEGGGQI